MDQWTGFANLLDFLMMQRLCLAPLIASCRRRKACQLHRLRLLGFIEFGALGVKESLLGIVGRIGLELLALVWLLVLMVHTVLSSLLKSLFLAQFLGPVGACSVLGRGMAPFGRFLGLAGDYSRSGP